MTMKLSWYRRYAGALMPCSVSGAMANVTGRPASVNRGLYEALAIFAAFVGAALLLGQDLDIESVFLFGLWTAAAFLFIELLGAIAYFCASKLLGIGSKKH